MSVDIESIRKRVEAATPGPWSYNSYSRVDADPLIANYDDPDAPQYPDDPRPGGTPGHTFFDEADKAWLAQHHAAYEADPMVASVPAEYGDTALGRHANDAEFIAHARTDVPVLLTEVARLREALTEIASGCDHCNSEDAQRLSAIARAALTDQPSVSNSAAHTRARGTRARLGRLVRERREIRDATQDAVAP